MTFKNGTSYVLCLMSYVLCLILDSPRSDPTFATKMEDEEMEQAIAESLLINPSPFSCQFCKKPCESKDELQLHQADKCPLIENSVSDDEEDCDLVFHDVAERFNESNNHSVESSVILVENNYTLDQAEALRKKMISCDDPLFKIQEHQQCVVINLNTAAFQMFKSSLETYLNNHNSTYIVAASPHIDQSDNVTQDTYRVSDRADKSSLFTINLYRTKSSAMINGPKHYAFYQNVLIRIIHQIDATRETLSHQNVILKSQIHDARKSVIEHSKSPLGKKKQRNRKSKYSASPKKVYSTRLSSQLTRHLLAASPVVKLSPNNKPGKVDTAKKPEDDDHEFPNVSEKQSEEIVSENQQPDLHKVMPNVDPPEQEHDENTKNIRLKEQKPSSNSAGNLDMDYESNEAEKIVKAILEDVISFCSNKQSQNEDDKNKSIPNESPTEETRSPASTDNSEEPINVNTRPVRVKQVPAKFLSDVPSSLTKKPEISPPESCDNDQIKETQPTGQVLYCLCRKPYDDKEGDTMTFCERCKQWFHYTCIGVDKTEVDKIKKFVCMPCAMKLLEENDQLRNGQHETSPITTELTSIKENETTKLKKEIKELKAKQSKSLEKINEAAANQKLELESMTKQCKDKAESLEIINRRCSQLQKQKVMSDNKEKELEEKIQELLNIIEESESHREELQKEISAHQKINEELISATPMRIPEKETDSKKEIDSLKLKVANLEEIVKEKEKSIQSLTTEVYSTKKDKERMGRIIDEYMKPNLLKETSRTTEQQESPRLDIDESSPEQNAEDGDETAHREQENNKSRRNCKFEMRKKGSCHYGAHCRFNHNIPESSRNFCETAFLNKTNTCADNNCQMRHDFNLYKLKRGPCLRELKNIHSCKFKSRCRFSHEIPLSCRNNTALIKTTEEAVNRSTHNTTDAANCKPPCPTEFYNQQCQNTNCNFRHGLDKSRLRRGPCLYEFYKRNVCPHGNKCRFTHDIPSDCYTNSDITSKVFEKVYKSQNKEKIAAILGKEVLNAADKWHQEKLTSSIVHSTLPNSELVAAPLDKPYNPVYAPARIPTPPWQQHLTPKTTLNQQLIHQTTHGKKQETVKSTQNQLPQQQQQQQQSYQQQISQQQQPIILQQIPQMVHTFQADQNQSQVQPTQYFEQDLQPYTQQVYNSPTQYFLPHVMKEIPVN